jgi:hypothetical protein
MQLIEEKEFSMAMPRRNSPFTLAEIMIAAPWATSLLGSPQDHDKGNLLHRNTIDDEWSALPDRVVAIEREARQARARALRRTFARLWHAVTALFRYRQRSTR